MNKEEFIKQRCEIDKITIGEFKRLYKVVECNCGEPYCHGYRCLELNDFYKQALIDIKEKIKDHKNDLDYEPWSVYKIDGKTLFDVLQIINKAIGDDENDRNK